MQNNQPLTSKEFLTTARQTVSLYWQQLVYYRWRLVLSLGLLPIGTISFVIVAPYITAQIF